MNDLDPLWELARGATPLPDPAELGTARAQLVAAITVDPEAGRSTRGACPPVQRHDRRFYRRRRMALIAVVAAAASAVVASLLVTLGGTPVSNAPSSRPCSRSPGAVSAALAALQMQARCPTPRPVHLHEDRKREWQPVPVLAVGERHPDRADPKAGAVRPIYVPGCRGGRQLRVQAPAAAGGTPGGQSCVPQPAYFPGMPASPRALRSYLEATPDVRAPLARVPERLRQDRGRTAQPGLPVIRAAGRGV